MCALTNYLAWPTVTGLNSPPSVESSLAEIQQPEHRQKVKPCCFSWAVTCTGSCEPGHGAARLTPWYKWFSRGTDYENPWCLVVQMPTPHLVLGKGTRVPREHLKGRYLQSCSSVARGKVSSSPCMRHLITGFCAQHSFPSTSLTHVKCCYYKRELIGTIDTNKQISCCT